MTRPNEQNTISYIKFTYTYKRSDDIHLVLKNPRWENARKKHHKSKRKANFTDASEQERDRERGN